jgi:hypothetical protein
MKTEKSPVRPLILDDSWEFPFFDPSPLAKPLPSRCRACQLALFCVL